MPADPINEELPPYTLPACLHCARAYAAQVSDWADLYTGFTDHQMFAEAIRDQTTIRLSLSAEIENSPGTDYTGNFNSDSVGIRNSRVNLPSGGIAGSISNTWHGDGGGGFNDTASIRLYYDPTGPEIRLKATGYLRINLHSGMSTKVVIFSFNRNEIDDPVGSGFVAPGSDYEVGSFSFFGATIDFVAAPFSPFDTLNSAAITASEV